MLIHRFAAIICLFSYPSLLSISSLTHLPFIFLYLSIFHALLPHLPPPCLRLSLLPSQFGLLFSPLVLSSSFPMFSFSSQCINQQSWQCILGMKALSVFVCVCKPASVQLRVCLVKTVKTSLRDTRLHLCPLSSNTGILKQMHMYTKV